MYSESKFPKRSRISNSQDQRRNHMNLSINTSFIVDASNSEDSLSNTSKVINHSLKLLHRRTDNSHSSASFGTKTPSMTRTVQPFKEISREVLVMEPDNDPNLVRYRSTIINSKLQIDKTKFSADSASRDISFLLDAKLGKGSGASSNTSQDPLSIIATDTQLSGLALNTNLQELKQTFLTQDNIIDIDEVSKLCPLNLIKRIPHEFLNTNLLKRDKNLFPKLGGPAGQKDADLLENWLDIMLSKAGEEKYSEEQKFEYSQIIYSTCLKEIVRQVSVQCIKRGELLERIWKSYLMLFLKTIKILHKSKQACEKTSKIRIKALNDKYESTIESLMKEIEGLQSKVSSIENEKSALTRQLELAEEREKKYIERLNILQNYYEQTIIRVHRLEDVNRNLNLVIAKTLDDYEAETSGSTVLKYKQVIRFRELTHLLAADPLLNKELCVIPSHQIQSISAGNQEIELENKIFLNELQQKVEDCKHDMTDMSVDTQGLVKYLPAVTQTYPDDFIIPTVDIGREEKPIDIEVLTRDILGNAKVNIGNDIKEESDEEGLALYDELTELVKMGVEDDDEILREIAEKLSERYTNIITKRLKNQKEIMGKLTYFLDSYSRKVEKLKVVKSNSKNLKLALINKFLQKNNTGQMEDDENSKHPFSSEENSDIEIQSTKLKKRNSKGTRRSEKSDKSPETKPKRSILRRKSVPKDVTFAPKPKQLSKPKENFGRELLERHKSSKSTVKVLMTKKSLIKKLQYILTEYSSNAEESQDLSEFLYFLLSKKFGTSKVTESKYIQICAACDRYRSNAFVDIFGRFLGLRNFLNQADLKVYLQIQELFQVHSKEGVDVSQPEADSHYTPLDRAKCVLNDLLKHKYLEEDIQLMKAEIETRVETCPKNMNSSGVIDTYYLIYYLLDKHRYYIFSRGDEIRDLFDAVDLEGKGYILFESWDTLFRCINTQEYDLNTSSLLFDNLCDRKVEIDDVEVPAMTQNRFCVVVIAFNLFPKSLQDAFFEVSSPEQLTSELNKLRENSENILFNLNWRYRIAHELKPEKVELLNLLKEKISNPDKPKSAYFAYKLIDYDSKNKLDQE